MTTLPPDLMALYLRGQQVCEDIATVRDELEKTRAQTQRLIAQSQQTRRIDWCVSTQQPVAELSEAPIAEPFTVVGHDSQAAAYEAAAIIRAILDEFQLHWQLAIVKALGARAAMVAQRRQA